MTVKPIMAIIKLSKVTPLTTAVSKSALYTQLRCNSHVDVLLRNRWHTALNKMLCFVSAQYSICKAAAFICLVSTFRKKIPVGWKHFTLQTRALLLKDSRLTCLEVMLLFYPYKNKDNSGGKKEKNNSPLLDSKTI